MLAVLLLTVQTSAPPILDLDIRPPASEEVQAAERRARRQVPRIVELCRAAIRSGDPDAHIRTFADRNGLSSYGRVTLAMNCLVYRQGTIDGARGR